MNQSNTNFGNDPDYGLPEVTLTPVDRSGMGRRKGTVRSGSRHGGNQDKKSNAPLVISLLFALLLVLAALWYFFGQDMFGTDPISQQTDEVENTTPDTQDTTQGDTNVDNDAGGDEFGDGNPGDFGGAEESTTENDVSGNYAVDGEGVERGTLDVIDSRTGRTYVIVGSFFDEDLARDYAAELGKQGINTTLLMPASGKSFYRLSVADFDTITEAINNLDDYRATYGISLWIIRY